MAKNSNETVKVLAKNLKMNQNPDMYMFEVTHWDFKHTGNYNQLQVLVVMKRKVLSEIMTTYFPTILLLAITFATTFFKPCFFDAALSVNLTTMLVMTTIFISKMEGLPPTSDIKMIDCWLILCQLVPFAQVVILTAKEYLRDEEQGQLRKEEQARKKRKKEKKKKRKAQKEETQEENVGESQGIIPCKDTTEGVLQLTIDKKEDGIERDRPLEAWALDQPNGIKSSLVTKLVVIGEYCMFTSD